MPKYILTILLIALSMNSNAQNNYESSWKEVTELLSKDQRESALEVLKKINQQALKQKNEEQTIKSQLYINVYTNENLEDFSQNLIDAQEKVLANSKGVEKAFIAYYTAQSYQLYYAENGYEITNRTATDDTSPEIDDWTAEKFDSVITSLYLLSIEDKALLQNEKVTDYKFLIFQGTEDARADFPTLYDVFARSAFEYFSSTYGRYGRARSSNSSDDKRLWWESEKFVKVDFNFEDQQTQGAVKVLQDWESFKLNSKNEAGLVQVYDARRRYVGTLYYPDDKVEQGEKSLLLMSKKHNVRLLKASDLASRAPQSGKISTTLISGQSDSVSRKDIRDYLIRMRDASKPMSGKSELQFENLISKLERISIEVSTESVVPRNQPILVKIEHSNMQSVKYQVYAFDPLRYSDYEVTKNIKELKLITNGTQELDPADDLDTKSTEFKIDGLPTGHYVLVCEDPDSHVTSVHILQCSDLEIFFTSDEDTKIIHVVDRLTGAPAGSATLEFIGQTWKKNRHVLEKVGSYKTDASGSLKFLDASGRNDVSHIRAIHGDDSYLRDLRGELYYYRKHHEAEVRNSVYTDRAIYRPGQQVHAKVISIYYDEDKNVRLRTGEKIDVELYDANDELVEKKSVKLNDMGSASLIFTLPKGRLSGLYKIKTGHGGEVITVEEYKRPQFKVEFEDPKKSFVLGAEATVKGIAKAYSGVPIAGAKVVYSVTRSSMFPYPWCYRPWFDSDEKVMITSETVTDEKGEFEITFLAEADRNVPSWSYPIFSYALNADVTDISGETRTGDYRLSLSRLPYVIDDNISSEMDKSQIDSLIFTVQNAQGQPVDGSMQVTIHKLKSPNRVYKPRLWAPVSYATLTESEFRKHFPYDAYQGEDDIENWKTAKRVLEMKFSDFQRATIELSKLKPGAYRIEMITPLGDDTVRNIKNFILSDADHIADIPYVINARADKETYKVGETMTVSLSSSLPSVNIAYMQNMNAPYYQQLQMKGSQSFKFKLEEEHRGKNKYRAVAFYQNRIYSSRVTGRVAFTDRELDIKLIITKDLTKPGDKENWVVQIDGKELHQKDAEVLASMYDASLDQFLTADWDLPRVQMDRHVKYDFRYLIGVDAASGHDTYTKPLGGGFDYRVPSFADQSMLQRAMNQGMYARRYYAPAMAENNMAYSNESVADPTTFELASDAPGDAYAAPPFPKLHLMDDSESSGGQKPKAPESKDIRENLQETAFFYPDLKTQKDGKVNIEFTVPDALTTWKLRVLAHSPDLAVGYTEHEMITQKDLMISPQLPRYLRQGDLIYFSTRIDNLQKNPVTAEAVLKIYDAISGEDVTRKFGINASSQSVSIPAAGQISTKWKVDVPNGWLTPVRYEVTASSRTHSDGQIGLLPVVTNRMLVTESMPLQVKGNDTKGFTFDKMEERRSATSADVNYVVEYSGSPIWYAVQSLPYLMDYPYDCSEQIFNKIYATAIAEHVATEAPEIRKRLDVWRTQNPDAMKSNLSKNEELKSAILEATPWVQEAQSEEQNMKNLVLLFDQNNLKNAYSTNISILRDRQLPSGGFAWFSGGHESEYITAYIACGISRLQQLGIPIADDLEDVLRRAQKYLYHELSERQKSYISHKVKSVSQFDIYELYIMSFKEASEKSKAEKEIEKFFLNILDTTWTDFGRSTQAMAAITLHRNDYSKTADDIMTAFDQNAIKDDEKGMYWKDFTGPKYYWYEAPIEGMSMMIAAYEEVKKDRESTSLMRMWLLKNKQVNSWETTKATADACYALLYGNDAIQAAPEVNIKLGKTTVKSDVDIPGVEYIKQSFSADQIQKDFDQIQVAVSKQDPDAISWGAVYWQYLEDMDRIKADPDNPLNIEKKIYRKVTTDQGEKLLLLNEGDKLDVGDKLTVRLLIRSDRDMEFIHIQDARSGCVEPTDVISSYHWGPLPHYLSTKDLSTNFFCDDLPRGSYVLEYDAFVNQKGVFSMGMATVQCMYAPEFGAHSQGGVLEVK